MLDGFALEQVGGNRSLGGLGRVLLPRLEELGRQPLAEVEVCATPYAWPEPGQTPWDEADQMASSPADRRVGGRGAERQEEVGVQIGMQLRELGVDSHELAFRVRHLSHPAAPVR